MRNTTNSSCEINPVNVTINIIENNNALLFSFSLISPSKTNPHGNANNKRGFVMDPLFIKELGSLTSKVLRPPRSINSKADSDDVSSLGTTTFQ